MRLISWHDETDERLTFHPPQVDLTGQERQTYKLEEIFLFLGRQQFIQSPIYIYEILDYTKTLLSPKSSIKYLISKYWYL